jgi:hypothetical protein
MEIGENKRAGRTSSIIGIDRIRVKPLSSV